MQIPRTAWHSQVFRTSPYFKMDMPLFLKMPISVKKRKGSTLLFTSQCLKKQKTHNILDSFPQKAAVREVG